MSLMIWGAGGVKLFDFTLLLFGIIFTVAKKVLRIRTERANGVKRA